MKRQDQDLLDNRLRKMPKPTLSNNKHIQIKQTIMYTRTSRQKNKRINIKGITATVGALAAAFLFAILIYGNLNQTSPPSAVPLATFIEEDVSKITGVTMDYTHSNNDIEVMENGYVSDDKEIIDLFYETIGTMQFTEVENDIKDETIFTEVLNIYNEHEEVVGVFEFSQTNLVRINGKQYEIETIKWEKFKDVFFTERYLVTEEDDEEIEPEEQLEETENVQELMNKELAIAPSQRDWDTILNYVLEGANPDKALLLAAKENNESVVAQLLNLEANPNTVDNNNDTPLTLTTSTQVAALLLDSGATIEHRNGRNYTALVKAVYGHQTEMVKLLLEHGADPNTLVTPSSDKTVLWMAAKYNFMPIDDILLEHGATPVEGYEFADWMASEVMFLEERLDQDFLSYAATGKLPDIMTVQLPADPSVFENQYGLPFESYEVDGGTADVYGDHIFIQLDDQDMYSIYRYELNPGDNVTAADIESILGSPSDIFSNYDMDRKIMLYRLDHYELRFIYDGTVNYPKQETAILALELHFNQPGVMESARKVRDLLAEREMTELANFVHPEKGVLFAPFLQLYTSPITGDEHEPIIFSANEIPKLLDDQTVYHWGDHGASGLPIEMTPIEFLDEYIYTAKEPDAFYVNQQNLMGPEFFTNHVRELYPEAHMVQYSFDETVEGYDLSWMQLTLIFEEYDGDWKLVGILHNEWTP